jgi:uncharacterized repeat protein (TIGR01451 family)
VSPGSVVKVRLNYSNTGTQSVTDAQIKDSLPAGFTYIDDTFNNCITPSTTEKECALMNSNQKNSAFANLVGNGVSPVAGLYDGNSSSLNGGTSASATGGILEIGKKRYYNLSQCSQYW